MADKNTFYGSLETGARNLSGDLPGELVLGVQGPQGVPGKTPKKGVDYWTPAEKQEIIEEVLGHFSSDDGNGNAEIEIPKADTENLGAIKVGENLTVAEDGTLSVDTAETVEETDARPITSQAVYSEFGKIVALLNTI